METDIDTESMDRLRAEALAENEARDWATATNNAVVFRPTGSAESVPEMEIAGVAVDVYVTPTGKLRVSLHTDTDEIDPRLLRDEGERVAMTITINGEEVFDWMADWT